jgi:transcription elongation factor GreA
MSKIPITETGFQKLKKELEILKTVSIPENIKDIEEARAHGDLSENAEYTAAKERQAYLHGKISELENNLASSEVIDLSKLKDDRVVFGSTVIIEDIDSGTETTYRLVGPLESNVDKNHISVTSPIGKALIGKEVGDEVTVATPGGSRKIEIVNIRIEEDRE